MALRSLIRGFLADPVGEVLMKLPILSILWYPSSRLNVVCT